MKSFLVTFSIDGTALVIENTCFAGERHAMTEQQLLESSIEHLHGPEEIPYAEDELVVVCLVRDGRPYVKSFIEHYFSLGAKHIAFLDNGSVDGTVEALKGYDNVTVLQTELPYKAHGDTVGNGWTRECLFKQYLISRFGKKNRWCLCVDIDELFDYPHSDAIKLESFLKYLNSKSYTAVVGQMLDMFPGKPLSDQASNLDEPLKDLHKFYDISNVRRVRMRGSAGLRNSTLDSEEVEFFIGGIRDTLFGTSPYLTKIPLVFLDGQVQPMAGSSHRAGNARIADITCVLHHYKFLDRHFHNQVEQAVREEHRINNSAKYKMYKKVLDENPDLQLLNQETAKEIESVNGLLEDQFLVVSDAYVSWANAEEEKNVLSAISQSGESSMLAESLLKSRCQERAKTLRIQRLEQQLRENRRRERQRRRAQRQRQRRPEELMVQDEALPPEAVAQERTSPPDPESEEVAASHQNRSVRSEGNRVLNVGLEKKAPEIQANQASGSKLLEKARPLFIGGCARSGTTAFANYLNQQEEILLCQERYKGRQNRVTWDLFTFERIMDFRSEETERPPLGLSLEAFVERHVELLASKDPTKLKWLGDKGPFYVRTMDRLAGGNPGARFIMLYRPIEEVAESWEARAKNPEDRWRSERDYKLSVEVWNQAMQGMRNFIENSPTPRVLIVSYHDFFYRNELVSPQISRFLGFEFDESVTAAWRDTSKSFENNRRRKESLNEEQQIFIQEHADREAEAWVLDRIERQWNDPGLYVEESTEAMISSLDDVEARMWRLQQAVDSLELRQARGGREDGKKADGTRGRLARERRENKQKVNELKRNLERERRKNHSLH